MAEYVFTIDDFSLTTTWKRRNSETVNGIGINPIGFNIVSDYTTKTFSINGIALGANENIKRVMLTATINRVGTTDYSERINVNGMSFSTGSKKIEVSEIQNNSTWDALFYVCASGNTGTPTLQVLPSDFSCTIYFSDVTLTITTGTGGAFTGLVEDLPDGAKILIDEGGDTLASYSIVKHNYNDGKCLIWRDDVISDVTIAFNHNNDTFWSGQLDQYLNDTFYNALPEVTKEYVVEANYPTLDKRLYGTVYDMSRYVCTPSVREVDENVGPAEGTILDYLDTVSCGSVYWTRSVYTSSSGLAYRIGTTGESFTFSRGYTSGVRPCFTISEQQLVAQDGDHYRLASQCTAPTSVLLNGSTSDISNLQVDAEATLSWSGASSGNGTTITGYAVWRCETNDDNYVFIGETTETSMVVRAPNRVFNNYYYKVQAITSHDTDYLDSPLSSERRMLATKRTNVYYYDGGRWLFAAPKRYDGSVWKESEGAKYYDGTQWVVPD